jgi:RHS repeat-associated protein
MDIEVDKATLGISTGNPFGYTGRRWDPDLNLYYYRARWYDPQLGTFLQTDPIGSLDYVNLYAYVGLEPGNGTDPSGKQRYLGTNGQEAGHWTAEQNAQARQDTELVLNGGSFFLPFGSVVRTVNFVREVQAVNAARAAIVTRMEVNAAVGKVVEKAVGEMFASQIASKQVTFVTSTGARARVDYVLKGGQIVEAKAGGAALTSGQRQLFADIAAGRSVTPVGKNASKAGFEPGVGVPLPKPMICNQHGCR